MARPRLSAAASKGSGDIADDDTVGFELNDRLLTDTPSPPVAIAGDWAKSFPTSSSPFFVRPRTGPTLLNLAQGIPGHPPSSRFLDRIASEASTNTLAANGYTDVFGVGTLRTAIATELQQRYQVSETKTSAGITTEHVAVTAGANLAFAVVAQALAQHGDAVVLPTPWYFNHHMTLASLGVVSVPLPTSAGVPSVAGLRSVLLTERDAKIRAVVLVTPNNPCGTTLADELMHQIFDLCAQASVALILDETYQGFIVPSDGIALARRPHSLFTRTGWQKTLIHISSFSKSYAIPGHRLGYIVAHPSLLLVRREGQPIAYGPIAKALDNYQICPPRADTQQAVAWAMHDPDEQEWRKQVAVDLAARHEAFERSFDDVVTQDDGKQCTLRGLGWSVESSGAYYAVVKHPFATESSEDVARAMAELVGVVTLPGSFFMPKGSTDSSASLIRISIANVSIERLAEVPSRLAILTHLWEERGQSFSPGSDGRAC
ncbi:hypothetical protein V8E36_000648 [Tilletia maclaganii]